MNDLFEEYISPHITKRDVLAHVWITAAGLQAADNLKTSFFLLKTAAENIAGRISVEDAVQKITEHYAGSAQDACNQAGAADLIAARIVSILCQDPFEFSVSRYPYIHAKLYESICADAGKFQKHSISRREWVLNRELVTYDYSDDFMDRLTAVVGREKADGNMPFLDISVHIPRLASFISDLWQIHPFEEGNTVTTAVFLIQYLPFKGFPLMNTVFAEYALYFRSALVRANYADPDKGIRSTTYFLELFLRNLLAEEQNELINTSLLI